jgi:hypothetical protein
MKFLENYTNFSIGLNEFERPDITPPEGGPYKWKREFKMKPDQIKFEVLAYDNGHHALAKEKSTGDLYIVDSFDNDPDEFYQYMNLPYEMDDEGDWELKADDYSFSELLDQEAIEAYATDIFNKKDPERLGVGLEDYQEGKSLIKIDRELIPELIEHILSFIESYSSLNSKYIKLSNEEIKNLKNMISILVKNYPKK